MPASLDLRRFPGCQLQAPPQKAFRDEHWKELLLLKLEKLDP